MAKGFIRSATVLRGKAAEYVKVEGFYGHGPNNYWLHFCPHYCPNSYGYWADGFLDFRFLGCAYWRARWPRPSIRGVLISLNIAVLAMPISSSIKNLQLLSFTYDGYSRIVEPHTSGVDTKGHPALRAYQVRGGSESGEYVGWKLFHVNEMRGLTVLAEHFVGARPKYQRGDSTFSTIHTQL